jgi:hypothetical protein
VGQVRYRYGAGYTKKRIPRDLAHGPVGFAFDLDPPDQRGDGLDRTGHGESPRQRQTGVRQTRLDALTDGLYLPFLFILIAKHFISTNTGTTQNEGRLPPLR